MKAFDLLEALKGRAVETKSRRSVTHLTIFEATEPCLVGVISGVVTRWFSSGHFIDGLQPSDMDLVMKE